MNEYYMRTGNNCVISKGPRSVCRKTPAFCFNAGEYGRQLYQRYHDVIAFLPVLVTLSAHVPELPISGTFRMVW